MNVFLYKIASLGEKQPLLGDVLYVCNFLGTNYTLLYLGIGIPLRFIKKSFVIIIITNKDKFKHREEQQKRILSDL